MASGPFTTTAITVGAVTQWLFNDPTMSIVLAGMAGGAVRWHYKKEVLKVGLGSVFIGGICAKYLGPLAMATVERLLGFEVSDDTGKMGAFLMGLGGVAILGIILDLLETKGATKSDEVEK